MVLAVRLNNVDQSNGLKPIVRHASNRSILVNPGPSWHGLVDPGMVDPSWYTRPSHHPGYTPSHAPCGYGPATAGVVTGVKLVVGLYIKDGASSPSYGFSLTSTIWTLAHLLTAHHKNP